jgi:hypothetical protein
MKPIGLLVVLVGCGAKPAEPLSTPVPVAPPVETIGPVAAHSRIAYPRPAIDIAAYLPDVAEYGRWPLTLAEHPALEPHFDIAGALADPGIEWTDLCARGAQHRHMSSKQELVDYLDAWCSVAKDDLPTAISKLGAARHASTVGVVQALKMDVASITAEHGSAHDLESFLRSGGFLTADQVDLVSAAYNEVGKLDDAVEANQLAVTMDYGASEAITCKRLLRRIADTSGATREDAVADLKDRAVPRKALDQQQPPRCVDAYAEVQCWQLDDCAPYWGTKHWTSGTHLPLDESQHLKQLLDTYRAWPVTAQTGSTWLAVAQHLEDTWPPHDKFELVLPALDLSLRASACDARLLAAVVAYAALLDGTLNTHLVLQSDGRPLGVHLGDRAPEMAGRLDATTEKAIHDHLALVHTQAYQLESAITAECGNQIAQLPPMTP